MRIAIVNDRFFPESGGGGTTIACSLAEGLSKKGHQVTVFCMNFGNKEFEKMNGFEVKRISLKSNPLSSKAYLEFLKKLPKEINLKEFDIVHLINPTLGFFFPKNSFIVSSLGSSVEEFKAVLRERNLNATNFSKILHSYFLEFFSLHKAKKVIAVSETTAQETKKHYFLSKKPEIIYCGIDLKKFHPIKNSKKNFLLFVGNFSERKGLIYLLEAMKKVNAKLKLVGDGVLRKKIEKYLIENNLNEKIELTEWKKGKELVKEFQNCLFFVFPSTYESFGLVNLEAMACGKTVVASNIKVFKEIISNGKDGLFFEKRNPMDLAEKINFLLQNPKKRIELEKNALKKAKSFSLDKMIEKHLNLYESLKEKSER